MTVATVFLCAWIVYRKLEHASIDDKSSRYVYFVEKGGGTMDKWDFLAWRAILAGMTAHEDSERRLTFECKNGVASFQRGNEQEYLKAVVWLQGHGVNLPGISLPWPMP